MATKLTKEVTRETNVMERGRPIVVTLAPNGLLIFREKGRKTGAVDLSIEAAYHLALKMEAARARREKEKG